MSGDTVYLSSKAATRDRYHTDPNCRYLERVDTVYSKDREVVEPHLSLCRYCSGEFTTSSSADSSYHVALKDANPEDVGLNPSLSD